MNSHITQFLKNVPGWLSVHEGLFLEKAVMSVSRKDGAIVEIGSFLGKSTIWMAMTGEKIYAVDPHKGTFSGGKTKPTYPLFIRNLSKAGVRKHVQPIVKTSKEAAKTWKKPIKFLFIDGMHDKNHAHEDYTLWSPYVTSGGIVAMHDAFCGWHGAGDVATHAIVQNPQFGEIGVVGSIIWGKSGKAYGFAGLKRTVTGMIINCCQIIHRAGLLPERLKFVIIHRFLRVFLINRFTSFL